MYCDILEHNKVHFSIINRRSNDTITIDHMTIILIILLYHIYSNRSYNNITIDLQGHNYHINLIGEFMVVVIQ